MFYLFISAESPNDDDDPLLPESKYSCDECEYSTSVQANLTTHKKRKQMNDSINLRNHIESKLGGVIYSYDKCEYSATTTGNLILHIKRKHESVRYPCNQCEYVATSSNKLSRHFMEKKT